MLPLLDHTNQTIYLPDLVRDRLAIYNFFFTGCNTVCPPQTALLREAVQQVRARRDLRSALFVSISVDPLGDGPVQLRSYAERFGLSLGLQAQWVMLTGTPPSMTKTLAAFNQPQTRPGEHSSFLWLGNQRSQRWTRTSSLNAPASLVQLIGDMLA
jgi:protein SCO1/2